MTWAIEGNRASIFYDYSLNMNRFNSGPLSRIVYTLSWGVE
jgi:hypothetical protein